MQSTLQPFSPHLKMPYICRDTRAYKKIFSRLWQIKKKLYFCTPKIYH